MNPSLDQSYTLNPGPPPWLNMIGLACAFAIYMVIVYQFS
jgi:hypothetical protein